MYLSLWAEICFRALINDVSITWRVSLHVCVSAQRRSADCSERPHRHSAADPQSTDYPHGAGHGNAPLCVCVYVFCPENHAWLDSWFSGLHLLSSHLLKGSIHPKPLTTMQKQRLMFFALIWLNVFFTEDNDLTWHQDNIHSKARVVQYTVNVFLLNTLLCGSQKTTPAMKRNRPNLSQGMLCFNWGCFLLWKTFSSCLTFASGACKCSTASPLLGWVG